MVLAGVLLKLGGFGLIVFNQILFQVFSLSMLYIMSVRLWGRLVVGLVCLSSVDIKKLIAYSSVIHINIIIISIFRGSMLGIQGALLIIIAHGLRSSGIFCLAFFNYEKTGTRNLLLYKGLCLFTPVINMFWFVLCCCNIAAPPSLNFISEVFICVRILKLRFSFFFICGTLVVIRGGYNLYLFSSQQGNKTYFLLPCFSYTSAHFLNGVSHSVPLGLLFFSLQLLLNG